MFASDMYEDGDDDGAGGGGGGEGQSSLFVHVCEYALYRFEIVVTVDIHTD